MELQFEFEFEFELWLFGDLRQGGRSERSERRSLCCSCGLSLSCGSEWRAGGADERSEFSVPRLLAIQA